MNETVRHGKARPPPLGEWDLLPDIILPDQEGIITCLSREMAGKKLLLLLCPDAAQPACAERLRDFGRAFGNLDPFVHIFGVTGRPPEANRAACDALALPFLVLSDVEGQVAAGLSDGHAQEGDGDGAFTTVLADENRRILRIDRGVAGPDGPTRLLDHLHASVAPAPRALGRFAPVLYIPKVVEPALCSGLTAAIDAAQPELGGIYRGANATGEHVIDPEVKVRRDLYIKEPTLLDALRWRFVRRMKPEIERAFTREVTGIDYFKVVRYDAREGGHFRAHRDNASRHTAHRRFAATINLNTGEYEGGALRFPEYGPDLYDPEAGDAVVFSCSLMHEVTPVTRGQRYALLFFMFDEESRGFNDRFRRPSSSPA